MNARRIVLITTGGTIEKTYNELTGELVNRHSIVRKMLRRLRFEGAEVSILELMSKDSLQMTETDRNRLVDVVRTFAGASVGPVAAPEATPNAVPDPSDADTSGEIGRGTVTFHASTPGPTPRSPGASEISGVVILHGTDTLAETGELIQQRIPAPTVPIVLTGAMRPYEMKSSDALQNLNEAIFATQLLAPGVFCVAHGRSLRFPGVRKDRSMGTFVQVG